MGQKIAKASHINCIRSLVFVSSLRGHNCEFPISTIVLRGVCALPRSYLPLKSPESRFCNISSVRHYSSVHNMALHIKARCETYPRSSVKRFPVPDEKVPWSVDFPEYSPVEHTSESVLKQPDWADLVDASGIVFNKVDEESQVDRRCNTDQIEVVDGRPRNPKGRTGVTGRGALGRWGPNHAGDPIVTRWKRDKNNEIVKGSDGKPILQFVSVQRRDNGEWALPGGMVNPGENRTATLIREFGEEALNTLEASEEERKHITECMENFFNDGVTIYTGYVDDPRNTDNAWMETKAKNFHDNDGTSAGAFKLNAGDDAQGVQWMDIDHTVKLYASHKDFIQKTVKLHDAHW